MTDQDYIATNEIGQLYTKYKDNLANYLRKRTDGSIEDLVQDTFERVLLNANKFDPQKAPFKRWLFVIGKNLAINQASRIEVTTVETLSCLPDVMARLEVADVPLSRIPQPFRDTLVLYACHGFSYKEIAEVQHINIQTVKSRIYRARTYVT